MLGTAAARGTPTLVSAAPYFLHISPPTAPAYAGPEPPEDTAMHPLALHALVYLLGIASAAFVATQAHTVTADAHPVERLQAAAPMGR